MATIKYYDYTNGGEYGVQRDDGTCYKSFTDFADAQAYCNYLQQLDNQQKVVDQNKQIIANQQTLINQNSSKQSEHRHLIPPQKQQVVQVLDPEYLEWLRYKKATDLEFLKWKEEEERKRQEQQEEVKKTQAEKIRKEEQQLCWKKVGEFKSKIYKVETCLIIWKEIFSDVLKLYKIKCKPSESFYSNTKQYAGGNGSFFQFGLLDDKYRADNIDFLCVDIQVQYLVLEELKQLIEEFSNSQNIIDTFSDRESKFNRCLAEFKLGKKQINYLFKYVYDIVTSEYIIRKFTGHGLLESSKINRIKKQYFNDNKHYHSLASSILNRIFTLRSKYPLIFNYFADYFTPDVSLNHKVSYPCTVYLHW